MVLAITTSRNLLLLSRRNSRRRLLHVLSVVALTTTATNSNTNSNSNTASAFLLNSSIRITNGNGNASKRLSCNRQFSRSLSSSSSSSNSNTIHTIHTTMNEWTTWSDGKATALQECVLPLSFESHKGSSGRVGILGGSAHYTGAPYYAAMASLVSGADLAFVFCAIEAATPIKSYSPELMVLGVYSATDFDECNNSMEGGGGGDENEAKREQLIDSMVQQVTSKLDRLHSLVIGPGMGRCPLVCEATARIIAHAHTHHPNTLALVLDADALWMLAQPQYRSFFETKAVVSLDAAAPIVLTPNVVEYKRLMDAFDNDDNDSSSSTGWLERTTIVKKGQHDVILQHRRNEHNDKHKGYAETRVMSCEEVGGKKRSGGIGDVLAGTLGTLAAWNVILRDDNTPKTTSRSTTSNNNNNHLDLDRQQDRLALSCWTGCCFVKQATRRAFDIKKRSMTAPDVLEQLGPAMDDMTTEESSTD